MCGSCFEEEFPSFPNYWGFEAFGLQLTQKLQAPQGLQYVGQTQIAKNYSLSTYKCAKCGAIWQLSEPDDAWRGFFLTEENAKACLSKISRDNKTRAFGCLAVIVLLALILLWHLSG